MINTGNVLIRSKAENSRQENHPKYLLLMPTCGCAKSYLLRCGHYTLPRNQGFRQDLSAANGSNA
jgi:hypothetical protein